MNLTGGGYLALAVWIGLAPAGRAADSKAHPALTGKACLDCHAAVVKRQALHAPVKEKQCEVCHQVPKAGGKASFTDAPENLCYACHEKQKLASGNVHGPVAVGACVACHDPHGGAATPYLTASGAALCFGCHTDTEARFKALKFKHKPLETGCMGCHSPHSSKAKFLLRAEGPALCATCHPKVLESAAAARAKHPPVTQQKACLNCHDPHATDHQAQLRADGLSTCLSCHDRKLGSGAGELADMKKLLAENSSHHGPVRDKDCTGCHKPHSSDHFRLLIEAYPKEFYTPFRAENFGLCFQCHDAALPRDEKTATLTDFRDGDRNLHFVHVNKTPKGRTCRACHETHASNAPNHIRKSVPFGAWSLPVNFAKTENGGTCAPGCHAPFSYDRKKTAQSASR
jgi:predicted CXXCH cytochrome family protein